MAIELGKATRGFLQTFRFINARRWIAEPMAQEILLRCSGLLEAARRSDNSAAMHLCTDVMVWILSLCGSLDIDLGQILFTRFPGVCPYCKDKPCACGPQKKLQSPQVDTFHVGARTLSLGGWQRLFSEIYGSANNAKTPIDRAAKATEEAAEVVRAIQDGNSGEFEAELADLVSRIIAIANCLKFNLEDEIEKLYPDFRCSKCDKSPCCCDEATVRTSYRPQ